MKRKAKQKAAVQEAPEEEDTVVEPAPKTKLKRQLQVDAEETDTADRNSDVKRPKNKKVKAVPASHDTRVGEEVSESRALKDSKKNSKKGIDTVCDNPNQSTQLPETVNPQKDNKSPHVNLRLIIKNIPSQIDEETLRRDFEECGSVTNLKLMCNNNGESRGMAFVTYADVTGYFAALEYHNTDYGGKRLNIRRAEDKDAQGTSPGPKPPGCNSIVLKKLSPDVSSDDLYDFFKACGRGPKKVGLLTDHAGISRCTARVDFYNESAVDEAVKLLDSTLKGQPLCMDYCKPKTW
jgi:RNA recognition motif-containing protein